MTVGMKKACNDSCKWKTVMLTINLCYPFFGSLLINGFVFWFDSDYPASRTTEREY